MSSWTYGMILISCAVGLCVSILDHEWATAGYAAVAGFFAIESIIRGAES